MNRNLVWLEAFLSKIMTYTSAREIAWQLQQDHVIKSTGSRRRSYHFSPFHFYAYLSPRRTYAMPSAMPVNEDSSIGVALLIPSGQTLSFVA